MNTASVEFWRKHRGLAWSNPNADETAIQEFLHDGMDLHNYQQDFLVPRPLRYA